MQTQEQREKRRKEQQGRLIRAFVAMLAAILAADSLLSVLISRQILPAVTSALTGGGRWSTDLTGAQLFVLLAGMSLILLLQLVRWMFPVISAPIQPLQEALEGWIGRRIPELGDLSSAQMMNVKEGGLLFLILLGLLLLKLSPYILFGILYIRSVIRTTDRIREQEEAAFREVEKERNRMLSDIAHDIRNPITTVAGYAQALDEGMQKDPQKQKEYLHAIRKKAERVSDLVGSLFEYTKLHAAGFSLEPERTDICGAVRELAADMYTDAEDAGMTLIPEIPEEPLYVQADPMQFARVIGNLLSNAVRYNPPGTRILTAVRPDEDGSGDVRILIADSGAAIPEETAARIFEPFSRGDEARRTDGGSGLGLSIAAAIVRMHGWELTLETDIPDYTKGFLIRIPW